MSPRIFDEIIKEGEYEYACWSSTRWEPGDEFLVRMRSSELSIEVVCLDTYTDRDGIVMVVIGAIGGAIDLKEDAMTPREAKS